jgi:multimeric flavodoxin WrbA
MRITILDGSPSPGPDDLGPWLARLEPALRARGHAVHRVALRDLRLRQCRGCFDCWVRTPGACTTRDDGEALLREYVAADVAVLASPVRVGFTSALLRRAQERLLPALHPYFTVREGECHHLGRYARSPRLALVHGHQGCDEEDAALLEALHRRAALNMLTTLALRASTARAPEEVADALDRLQRLAAREGGQQRAHAAAVPGWLRRRRR